MITELKDNQIFVFGSNLNGNHAGGAARQAYDTFGAVWGQGVGLQGQSYAIPTLDENMQKMSLERIGSHLEDLVRHAGMNEDKEYLLTPIGQGIAGFSKEEIESILPELPKNIIKVNW